MSRRWRIALALAGGIVAVELVLAGMDSLTGGTPGGPTSSSYATGADGDAAWAELLARDGHEVTRLRVTPSQAELPPGATAIVVDPPVVLERDSQALRQFVRAGGRLVAGGPDASWVREIVGGDLRSTSTGIGVGHPLAPAPEVAGVENVHLATHVAWERLGGALPVLGQPGAVVAAVADVGAGRVVFVADDTPFQNASLARDDDARFALDITGPPARPVLFFENYHGYGKGSSSGLSAIPGGWLAAILLGFGAVIVYLVGRGRRLGPPELERREFDPPRREYVEAMAGILARTKAPEALAPLHAEVRRRLAGRARTPLETPEALVAAALARGMTADEAAAVARAAPRSEDVLALGRALARLG